LEQGKNPYEEKNQAAQTIFTHTVPSAGRPGSSRKFFSGFC
jgi:hypothetical protein